MDSTPADPYADYHMSICIQEQVAQMTDTQECMRYMAGRLYEKSKTDPAAANVTMSQIRDYCTGPNLETPLGFYVKLCEGTTDAYSNAFASYPPEAPEGPHDAPR